MAEKMTQNIEELFPAGAGVIRDARSVQIVASTVPRRGGGDPTYSV